MEIPFRYNVPVTGRWAAGRKTEVKFLAERFISLQNTMIVSPRKWGKSSLVEAASSLAMDWDLDMRVCKVDMFNIRSREEFFVALVRAVVRAVSKEWDSAAALLKELFPSSEARISVKTDCMEDVVVDFDFRDVRRLGDFFWTIPEKVAGICGLRLVVVVDEFHRAQEFSDFEGFVGEILRHWTGTESDGRSVVYCLCGSSPVATPSWCLPALEASWGAPMVLSKIPRKQISDMVAKEFSGSGKYIDKELCHLIYDLSDGHPHYIQQIAQMAWLRTGVVCTEDVVRDAHLATVGILANVFQQLTESLTSQQVCYLKAVVAGEKIVSTAEILYKYRISSATSASRSKASLLEREIIVLSDGAVFVQDPLYLWWLRNVYFEERGTKCSTKA